MSEKTTPLMQPPPRVVTLPAVMRLSLAVVAGIAVAAVLAPWVVDAHTRLLAAWDAAVCVYLTLSWAVMRSLDARATRARVQSHDQSGYVVFLIVVAGACASLVAVTWGLREMHDLRGSAQALHVVLAMLALAGSWLLIHTVFAFHYARAYYRPQAGGGEHLRGLRFPGDTEPDYIDFLYYACVIGMTSQVADVAVTSRHMRRLTLVHGVASFAFNLVVLALGVNLVAGAIQ
jgi:uncharacterized membrane protein